MMQNLTSQRCIPCKGGTPPMKFTEFMQYLDQVPGWKVQEEKSLERNFQFRNFSQALKFVNDVAEITERENHHPNIYLHDWNQVLLNLTTNAIGGLSINDFILAAKINEITR